MEVQLQQICSGSSTTQGPFQWEQITKMIRTIQVLVLAVEGWTSLHPMNTAAIFFGHAANGLKSLEMSPTRRVKLFAPLDGVSRISSCNDDEGVYSCIMLYIPVYINQTIVTPQFFRHLLYLPVSTIYPCDSYPHHGQRSPKPQPSHLPKSQQRQSWWIEFVVHPSAVP